MARRGKKKGGLQRKVSSVFNQVSVPQQEGDQQLPTEPAQDGSPGTSSKPMSTDSLVSKSSLMKKVCRPQDSSDKVKPDRKVSVPSKRKTPKQKKVCRPQDSSDKATPRPNVNVPSKRVTLNHSSPQVIEMEESPEAKISTDDELKADRIVSPPSWMSPDKIDAHDSPIQASVPSEDSSSKAESDVKGESLEAAQEESLQAKDLSAQMAPNEKSGIPPKLTTPDHPISKKSSAKKPKQVEATKETIEPDHKDVVDSQTPPAVAVPTSQTSPPEKSHQAQSTQRTMAPDRAAEAPRVSKAVGPPSPQKSESEKRYGPEAPQKENLPSAQPATMTLEERKGPSLRQRINNKFSTSETGVGSTRQKAMMLSIPILIIILIFAFRQVLSTSPNKSKGASSEDDAPVITANSGYEIDWKIPEPLPEIMRDPAKLLTQNDTTQIEPDQPTPIDISKLINLGGIMYSQDKSSAIINGRIVSVGEIVSGITVLKINMDSVEFERDGEKWVLKVED